MASSPKDKFDAAVKVIRGLPKNGSFQPSHELMLKFYSYYKQATEGPCISSKPGFWDLVNRRKWEAWSSLGEMKPEQAMLLYVDELKKVSILVREDYYPPQIVETMPQTQAVTDFLQKLDTFYELVEDSENHNTLKVLDKPWPNGSVPTNGTSENENGLEDSTSSLDHSKNVTMLLKQDVKWWQGHSGIINGNRNNTNSMNGASSENNGNSCPVNGDVWKEIKEETDELESDKEEENGKEEERHGGGSSEEWEEVADETRLSNSQSGSVSDSETDNEEFCDTSDEPVEPITGTPGPSFSAHLSPLLETVSTSTPTSHGKSVHFEPPNSSLEPQGSNSLFVNVSCESDKTTELISNAQHSLLQGAFSGSSNGSMDISTCRGGEGESREGRRKAGGQGSQGWSTPGGGNHQFRPGFGHDGNGGRGNHQGALHGAGGGDGGGGSWRMGAGGELGPSELNEQIVVTLLRLQHDMSGVLNRLNSLEALVKEGKLERERKSRTAKSWWPFPDLSMKSALVVFVWPLFVHFIIMYISRRRRRLGR